MAFALINGLPPHRSLTYSERLTIAAVCAEPTHAMGISSGISSRTEFMYAWTGLLKRIKVRKSAKGPLVYLATFPRTVQGEGYHLHALLWEFVPLGMDTLTIIAGAIGEWNYFILGSAIEIMQLAAIGYYAWTWPTEAPPT